MFHPQSLTHNSISSFPLASAAQFVDKHRRLVIGKVKDFQPILDFLPEKKVITQVVHADLSVPTSEDTTREPEPTSEDTTRELNQRTCQDTMRELYDLLNSNTSKEMFYQALAIHEKTLVDNV